MKILTAHSFRGGTGKTNIIANLAYALAITGKRVGVVDADATHPSLHIIFGLGNKQPSPTFGDFLLNKCSPDKIIHDISRMYGLEKSLYLIPSRLDDEIINKILLINQNSFHIEGVFNALKSIGEKKLLDYLLIDTKPELDERVLLYIMNSQAIFLMTRHDEADIRGTKELLKRISCIPKHTIHIVPSMIQEESAIDKKLMMENQFSEFDQKRIIVTDAIVYSSTLSNIHAPKIDQLFIKKYPDDRFSKSILNLAEMVQKLYPA